MRKQHFKTRWKQTKTRDLHMCTSMNNQEDFRFVFRHKICIYQKFSIHFSLSIITKIKRIARKQHGELLFNRWIKMWVWIADRKLETEVRNWRVSWLHQKWQIQPFQSFKELLFVRKSNFEKKKILSVSNKYRIWRIFPWENARNDHFQSWP